MSLREVLVAAVAFIIGAGIQSLIVFFVLPNMHYVWIWFYSRRNHKKYGEPCKTDLVLDKRGYSLGYSLDRRCALWVSYILTKGSVGVDIGRSESFFAEPDVPAKYRVSPKDYTRTGFDKGHLAPSAAIDFSEESNLETFSMANVSLQNPKLNRQAWGSVESYVRSWTYTRGKLCVTTGPIYGEKSKLVNDIPVPKAFYKVVYSFKWNKWIGFIFPNEPVSTRNVWDYAMTVKEVEKQTKLKFMKKLDKKALSVKKDLNLAWWKNGIKIQERYKDRKNVLKEFRK